MRAWRGGETLPDVGAGDGLIDLLRLAEAAGFREVHLQMEVEISRSPPLRWQDYLQRSPNPNIPRLDQVPAEALTPEEGREYEDCRRPVAERGGDRFEGAVAFMWAVKTGTGI